MDVAAQQTLQLSSGSMHALSGGPSTGVPALCVRGLSATARSFEAIAARLAGRGRRVVAVDLRGRGFSPPTGAGTYGWRRHAQDVLEAARLCGFGSFDLLGHSMGAFVSMEAAAIDPGRIRRPRVIYWGGVL